jgi:hypothetical protein
LMKLGTTPTTLSGAPQKTATPPTEANKGDTQTNG